MRVAVYGLFHLGCVTAACLAAGGHDVTGLDLDTSVVDGLNDGRAPLHEPGLDALIADGLASGRLGFTSAVHDALVGTDVVCVTFDTPVDADDGADVGFVDRTLDALAGRIPPTALLLVFSQVPVGFTRAAAHRLGVRGGYSPENLRLGNAIAVFRAPDRVVVGLQDDRDRNAVSRLFGPFTDRIEWMSLESAEMTKHALNAFLATSVSFANEVARLCERVGADAREVARGLKTESRIGPRAYLAPGSAFAGGTLARDVRFLREFGKDQRVETPALDGVLRSNDVHKAWIRDKLDEALAGVDVPVVAMLGLTYKPGTSTLRRSHAIELCEWLGRRGVAVRAHDPAVTALPDGTAPTTRLCKDLRESLRGADVAVLATGWPEFEVLSGEDVTSLMRRPHVIDENWFLASALERDDRIVYQAVGRGAR